MLLLLVKRVHFKHSYLLRDSLHVISQAEEGRICETSWYDVSDNSWKMKPHTIESQPVTEAFEHFRAWTCGEEPPYPDHIELPPLQS
jgi:hypothetical protein